MSSDFLKNKIFEIYSRLDEVEERLNSLESRRSADKGGGETPLPAAKEKPKEKATVNLFRQAELKIETLEKKFEAFSNEAGRADQEQLYKDLRARIEEVRGDLTRVPPHGPELEGMAKKVDELIAQKVQFEKRLEDVSMRIDMNSDAAMGKLKAGIQEMIETLMAARDQEWSDKIHDLETQLAEMAVRLYAPPSEASNVEALSTNGSTEQIRELESKLQELTANTGKSLIFLNGKLHTDIEHFESKLAMRITGCEEIVESLKKDIQTKISDLESRVFEMRLKSDSSTVS